MKHFSLDWIQTHSSFHFHCRTGTLHSTFLCDQLIFLLGQVLTIVGITGRLPGKRWMKGIAAFVFNAVCSHFASNHWFWFPACSQIPRMSFMAPSLNTNTSGQNLPDGPRLQPCGLLLQASRFCQVQPVLFISPTAWIQLLPVVYISTILIFTFTFLQSFTVY